MGTGRPGSAELASDAGPGVTELVAGASLLEARLDWFQPQLARRGERGAGDGAQG
ncbi:hypothetical protein [Streptomyces sp. SudanB182_2057]|uniref:hypothetical protein n=1 Tax=Streptomyces sp. SudanB182_2057 TaxID=3035281 RepID=UPI003F553BF1